MANPSSQRTKRQERSRKAKAMRRLRQRWWRLARQSQANEGKAMQATAHRHMKAVGHAREAKPIWSLLYAKPKPDYYYFLKD